ncbi:hypothetical protein [Streptomyces hokutonensis]
MSAARHQQRSVPPWARRRSGRAVRSVSACRRWRGPDRVDA